ncbi:MAG: DUF3137 domain-containing protein [Oscillospiraceae bacterium]|nr:DUF3137 domain-containing protein [Oscillospiraceae bacterium]
MDLKKLGNIPMEFENIYEQLFNSYNLILESMRKKALQYTIFQYVSILIIIFGCIFLIIKLTTSIFLSFLDPIIYTVFLPLIIFIVLFIIFPVALSILTSLFNYLKHKPNKYYKQYCDACKKEIIPNLIKMINPQLIYKSLNDNDYSNIELDYKKAIFDARTFSRFYTDNYYIEENLTNDIISIYNLRTEDTDKKVNFEGIFAHFLSTKNIGTHIQILKKLPVTPIKSIKMDNEEFNKRFDVFSENEIITMQLLTSDMMESLVDFYDKYYISYDLEIRNNAIYIRFFTGPMFEPKIFGSSMDKQLLFTYYCVLKFVLKVTQKINKTLQELEI